MHLRFPFSKREAGPAASPVHHQQNNEGAIFSTVALDDDFTRGAQRADSFRRPAKQPLLSQQSLEYQGHDGIEQSPLAKPWRPLMLRRWVLIVFALVFALLVMALEIILRVSSDREGFAWTESHFYYVYTYGPTAGKELIIYYGCLTDQDDSADHHCCILDASRVPHEANATMGRNGKRTTVRRQQPHPGLCLPKSRDRLHPVVQEPSSTCCVDPIGLASAQGLDRPFYRHIYTTNSATTSTTTYELDGTIQIIWPQCFLC